MSAHLGSAHIDPVDDDTPVSNLKPKKKSKPKLQEPDPFDGSNSHKLRTFILQCKLNFQDYKDMFEDDTKKVNYVLSYLKGTPLDCFESAILDPIKPQWLWVTPTQVVRWPLITLCHLHLSSCAVCTPQLFSY